MDGIIGEVRPFAFNWVPQGWLACNGASYTLNQYQALVAVIGYTYGGSGQTFNVPNLQGEAIVGVGQGTTTSAYIVGQTGGVEAVALTVPQIPNHTHVFDGAAGAGTFRTGVPASTSYLSNFGFKGTGATAYTAANGYVNTDPDTPLHPNSVSQTGSGGGHENRQPYLAVNYCICADGTYPIKP